MEFGSKITIQMKTVLVEPLAKIEPSHFYILVCFYGKVEPKMSCYMPVIIDNWTW